jgi:hypothetical protein
MNADGRGLRFSGKWWHCFGPLEIARQP